MARLTKKQKEAVQKVEDRSYTVAEASALIKEITNVLTWIHVKRTKWYEALLPYRTVQVKM